MEAGMAALHIGGAIIASFAFGIAAMMLAAWEGRRLERRRRSDMSIALGVPASALEDDAHVDEVIRYMSDRASVELLRNRVSDVCGLLRSAWGWLGLVLQVCVLGGAIWYTFTEGNDSAVIAWGVPAIAVFFGVVSIAFSLACYLLTGRYPGEAGGIRKGLRAFHAQRHGD